MRSRTTILILGAAQFVMVLDTTVMNVSISEVVSDLDTTVPQVQLAITAYALVMAAFMLTGAKLGDMYGRRRIFAIGLGIYGTGSLITAISPNVEVLLFGWSLVEGLGACLVIPSIAALTAANYSGSERAMAYGLLGGIAGAGVAAGPLIGGFVTTVLTWRVVFAAETVVVVAILIFGIRRIQPGPSVEREKLDLVGAGLSAIGLGLVVFGILKSSEWGLFQPTGALEIGGESITPFGLSAVPFIVVAGIFFLGLFRSWELHLERRGGKPLLRPGMLQVPQLRGGLTMFISSYLLMAGTFFVLPLYLQLVIGDNTLETGIKILPISVAMILAAILGSRAADRISPRRIVRGGLLLLFAGLMGTMATISPDLNGAAFAVSLGFFGAGVGLIVSQLGNVVMSSVGEDKASEAGGLQGAAQSLGSSLGTALIGAILLAGLTTGLHDNVRADSSIPPEVQEQIVQGTEQGVPMVSSDTAEELATDAGLTTDEVAAVVDDYEASQIDALKRALLGASFFALFAFWIAAELPGAPLGASGTGPGPRGREPPAIAVAES
jgi:MFS family permease